MVCNACMNHALQRAIDACKGGLPLSERIGATAQRLSNWKVRGVPAEHCPAIERATGGAVRCEDLRPDVDWGVLRGDQPCNQPQAEQEA